LLEITAKDEHTGVCPLCREEIALEGARCEACATSYHEECLLEFGGTCVTLGCKAPLPGYEAAPLEIPLPGDRVPGPDELPTTDRALAPEGESPAEEPAPLSAEQLQARAWRMPSLATWIVTGLVWFAPTVLYRLSTSTVFFDLSFWGNVLAFALPVWCAAAILAPMYLRSWTP
jgi:hypothetical protein